MVRCRARLPAEVVDRALQLAHARLARVLAEDLHERRVVERDVGRGQPVLLRFPRDQVAPRDLELLLVHVPGNLDHFEAVQERGRDEIEHVGGRDEQRLREIERDLDVVVHEVRVLLGVEHFEERSGGIALGVVPQLVDLVDHEDRVARVAVAQTPDDLSGPRADVGAPVAPDLGFVADAADAHPDERAPQRAGDGRGERRLAGARRAGETEDGPLEILLQLRDREVLEDPLLHLLQAEVLLVQAPLHLVEIDLGRGAAGPRERKEPVDVVPDHPRLLGRLREIAEAIRLLLHDHQDVMREVEPIGSLEDLPHEHLLGIVLAEQAADLLDLLSQEKLPLGLLHLRAGAPDHVLGDGEPCDLGVERLGHKIQPLGDVEGLDDPALDLERETGRWRRRCRRRDRGRPGSC